MQVLGRPYTRTKYFLCPFVCDIIVSVMPRVLYWFVCILWRLVYLYEIYSFSLLLIPARSVSHHFILLCLSFSDVSPFVLSLMVFIFCLFHFSPIVWMLNCCVSSRLSSTAECTFRLKFWRLHISSFHTSSGPVFYYSSCFCFCHAWIHACLNIAVRPTISFAHSLDKDTP